MTTMHWYCDSTNVSPGLKGVQKAKIDPLQINNIAPGGYR